MNAAFSVVLLLTGFVPAVSLHADDNNSAAGDFQPMVAKQFLEEAKKNTNWKTAFATGKEEQIVFMNISPLTNPNNEIGTEVHPFDQVILIVQGSGKAILNGNTSSIKSGDMIFIPQGVEHNVTNSDPKKELKLVSFYSQTDIPKGAVYPKKSDQAED